MHIRQAPDMQGNIVSPIASIFELGSFVNALTELAFTAEVARSTPSIVTQVRKPDKGAALDTGALFFDTESRNVKPGRKRRRASRRRACSSAGARSPRRSTRCSSGTAARRCRPTRGARPCRPTSLPSCSRCPRRAAAQRRPPLTFLHKTHNNSPSHHRRVAGPKRAPHVQAPQPRGDLGPLTELSIQQFSAALGQRRADFDSACTRMPDRATAPPPNGPTARPLVRRQVCGQEHAAVRARAEAASIAPPPVSPLTAGARSPRGAASSRTAPSRSSPRPSTTGGSPPCTWRAYGEDGETEPQRAPLRTAAGAAAEEVERL